MKIIKNSEELAKLVDEKKDLRLENDDLRVEFEPSKEEIRDIYCQNFYLEDDTQKFNFNGRDFNGRDFNGGGFKGWNFNGRDFNGWDFNGGNFNGRDFNGGDFNGWDFNGGNFNGWDFNGGNFNGGKVSYYAFFNCRNSIRCTEIKGRRNPCNPPVCLDGKLEIIEEKPVGKRVKIKVADGKIVEGEIVED